MDATGQTSREPQPESSDSTSTSLIRGLKAQDGAAWRRLLDLYSPLIYSWCRRSDMNPEDSADVLQEVFRAAFSNISKFQHDRAGNTFRGWLRTIARNKIRDHFRRRGGQAEAAGGTAAYERFQEVSAEETGTSAMHELGGLFRVALKSIQGEFEERTWQAFRQVTMDENDVADVADRLEMSPAAVRQAKYRVLRRLRQELGDRPE